MQLPKMKNNLCKTIDFIGIGAPKCGSTWTASCLREAPEILFSKNENWKEISYFNTRLIAQDFLEDKRIEYNYRHKKTIDWYLDQFPNCENGKIIGEFSTEYLFDRDAPYRIRKYFPNTKIIVNLRYPPDFIYSLYWERQTSIYGYINKSFERLLSDEYNYKNIGLYYEHLKRYYEIFSKENIHVILFDDINRNPELVVKKLYGFLEVSTGYIPTLANKQIVPTRIPRSMSIHEMAARLFMTIQKSMPKNAMYYHEMIERCHIAKLYDRLNRRWREKKDKYPTMEASLKKQLSNFYEKDIKRLEGLIERDLSHWYKRQS